MRHKLVLVLVVPALCFLFVATSLYLGRDHLSRTSHTYLPLQNEPVQSSLGPTKISITTTVSDPEQTSAFTPSASITPTLVPPASTSTPPATASSAPSIKNGTILSAEQISRYVSAILDPTATDLPRLECPALDKERYKVLQEVRQERDDQENALGDRINYFFALNLRECVHLLPRLLGSVVEAIRFLGPHRCALSIVEGNSPDGTGDVLLALRPILKDLGVTYIYNRSKVNPSKGDRIQKLAELRNLALRPLYQQKVAVTEETTVLFINDVAACPEDLLELVLQRRNIGADMTCAMDWTYVGNDPTFYDIWVARALSGDSFFRVGDDGNWNSAWNLFWNAPETKDRYNSHLPFQVFACWNGATVFTAAPLLHGLRFRSPHGDKGECFQGEPELFCKDLWFRGYRKIAVVPTVNLEYSDERGEDIKNLKGYVSQMVQEQDEESSRIDWVLEPPREVRCMPDFQHQTWRPWNETLS
ncbi:cryptococcal mannosyltransferase 1-domain-containing protein, partial [Fusarium solani]